MFGGKKNNLPPRPSLPLPEQILEDLHSARKNDITFNFVKNENEKPTDLHFPMNVNDNENFYGKARRYLDGIQKLKLLTETLDDEQKMLEISYSDIVKLAQDIRDQAQAVLVK